MSVYFYALAGISVVSLFSFAGALALAIKPEKLSKITMFLVALSAGTLLGDTFIHLLPEAIEKNSSALGWLTALGGIMVFFILEKIICWRHCHVAISEDHPHPLGKMNLIGDGLHNLIDGIVIAGAFLANPTLGWATTLAVIAHEIPQEISDFGVLIHAGYTRKRALFLNFLSALVSFVGAFIAFALNQKMGNFSNYALLFTAGGFIYIASADLIPELRKENSPAHSVKQLLAISLGIFFMWLLKNLFSI